MTNFELLKAEMDRTHIPVSVIASLAGIERATLYNRLNGKGEFKASEIDGLTKVLKLTKAKRDAIFFAR